MMVAEPGPLPVICGEATGEVAPAAIVTVAGEMVILLLLLDRVTSVPPVGAGADKAMGKGTDCPNATFVLVSVITPMVWTLTDVLAAVMPGTAELAVIVVVPTATPVTGKLVVVAPAAKVAVAGMLMMPEGLADKLTTKPPAGAGAERVKLRFRGVLPISVNPPVGPKPSEAPPTVTVWLSLLYPPPEAKIVAEPNATPVTWGWVAGVVWPAAMVTEEVTVAFVGSLLVRLMVTPPDGAAVDNVTGILML